MFPKTQNVSCCVKLQNSVNWYCGQNMSILKTKVREAVWLFHIIFLNSYLVFIITVTKEIAELRAENKSNIFMNKSTCDEKKRNDER